MGYLIHKNHETPYPGMKIERPPMLIFFGLPGSGKSTAAMKLEQRLEGYRRFNPDESRREMGITRYRQKDTPRVVKYIEANLIQRFGDGQGVILDSILLTGENRQHWYRLAREMHIDVISTYVTCSEATSLDRIRKRPKNDDLHVPGRTARVYKRYKDRWMKEYGRFGLTFGEAFELAGYRGDINLAINRHVAVLRYDTDLNTVEIKEKYLRPALRQHAERVKAILLEA